MDLSLNLCLWTIKLIHQPNDITCELLIYALTVNMYMQAHNSWVIRICYRIRMMKKFKMNVGGEKERDLSYSKKILHVPIWCWCVKSKKSKMNILKCIRTSTYRVWRWGDKESTNAMTFEMVYVQFQMFNAQIPLTFTYIKKMSTS